MVYEKAAQTEKLMGPRKIERAHRIIIQYADQTDTNSGRNYTLNQEIANKVAKQVLRNGNAKDVYDLELDTYGRVESIITNAQEFDKLVKMLRISGVPFLRGPVGEEVQEIGEIESLQ